VAQIGRITGSFTLRHSGCELVCVCCLFRVGESVFFIGRPCSYVSRSDAHPDHGPGNPTLSKTF